MHYDRPHGSSIVRPPGSSGEAADAKPVKQLGAPEASQPEPVSISHRRLLIVDDNEAIHDDFRKVLCPTPRPQSGDLAAMRAAFLGSDAPPGAPAAKESFELCHASQGLESLEMISSAVQLGRPFSVAFVDVRMPPGIDGVETARRLWEIDPDLQVVICSAYSDYSWDDMVQRLGTSERWVIMRKPFDPVAVRQLATAMACKWRSARQEKARSDELERRVEERTRALQEANLALQVEMSRLERARRQIDHMAHHDSLTRLPNRRYLEQELERAMAWARERSSRVAVLSVDLDNFKRINDSLGHAAGDAVLCQVAERITSSVRAQDVVACREDRGGCTTVARFGGDEFIVLLKGVGGVDTLAEIARRIDRTLGRPLYVDGHELRVSASIGISLFPDHGEDVASLIGSADRAMYHIKRQGRGAHQVYSDALGGTQVEELKVEADLIRALEQDELELFYQPIYDTREERVCSLEALIRWRHPVDGLVPPGLFLPLAEEVGLIVPIGAWVVREACRQGRAWLDQGVDFGRISVNVSARQLGSDTLVTVFDEALASSQLPPDRLTVELTETALLVNGGGRDCLEKLVARGLRVALDDFGTGYSSLKHLVNLPIHALKIDASFVRDAHRRLEHAAVVEAIIAMTRSLGLEVVAEGVETVEELEFLTEAGCAAIQGYLFSRPIPAEGVGDRISSLRASRHLRLSA